MSVADQFHNWLKNEKHMLTVIMVIIFLLFVFGGTQKLDFAHSTDVCN